MKSWRWSLLFVAFCSGCTPPPPVNQSRDVLWQQFGGHKLDEILLSWGTPDGETHLTDGSRLVTYRHSTTLDAMSPYEYTLGCEVSFLAPPHDFKIKNIAMKGDPHECALLAQGHTGYRRDVYVPPPPPLYPYYYR